MRCGVELKKLQYGLHHAVAKLPNLSHLVVALNFLLRTRLPKDWCPDVNVGFKQGREYFVFIIRARVFRYGSRGFRVEVPRSGLQGFGPGRAGHRAQGTLGPGFWGLVSTIG